VRTIGQQAGYTERGTGRIKVPSPDEAASVLQGLGLDVGRIRGRHGEMTSFGKTMAAYFQHRADILNRVVEPCLMSVDEAKRLYSDLRKKLKPRCPIPMNKQSGTKRTPAYLTAIVNMLVEANAGGAACDYDPRELTTVTRDGAPLRTLARRVDGAFPGAVNPIAIWEIKEYYHTTTFGSRVADGVYETLLDGMEIEELREHEGVDVRNYLIIDAYYTWWDCGRSYLCRIIDMLHMGYVDEVLFGREVLNRLPELVHEWVALLRKRGA
jgi:hypothetical protein